MTFELKSLVLAEGVTSDARGSIAVVGYNPIAWNVPSLPAPIAVWLIATLEETPSDNNVLTAADRISFSPVVKSPSGEVLLAGTAQQELQPVVTPNGLPPEHLVRAVIVVQAPIVANEQGVYTFDVAFEAKGQPEVRGSTRFAVNIPPAAAERTPPG